MLRTRRFITRAAPTIGISALASMALFFVYTRKCSMTDLPVSDMLLRCKSYLRLNPTPVPWSEMRDVCTRRHPLNKFAPDLVQDARRWGTAMIEQYCQGVFGGSGYTLQRLLLAQLYRSLPETQSHVWSKRALQECTYDVGTLITDHLVVMEKTTQSVILRCGGSPRYNPDSPRDMDGLVELQAVTNIDHGYVEFQFKSAFFVGTGYKGAPGTKVLPWVLEWMHRQYTKFLVEAEIRSMMRRQYHIDKAINCLDEGHN